MAEGIYHGHLVCDGEGNLLADEGEHKGMPVAEHEGSYVFVQRGEPSHNQRHHQNLADVTGTQSVNPDAPGYVKEGDADNQHHFGVLEDDPNFDADSASGVKLVTLPVAISEKATGHTEAYRGR